MSTRHPRSLNDRIPRDLATICLKSMAKEPARRYETAGAEHKRKLLDQAQELLGYHRKSAIRALRAPEVERGPVMVWVIVAPASGTLIMEFLASSVPFWIASGTSFALP